MRERRERLESKTGTDPTFENRVQYPDHWVLAEWTVSIWFDPQWKVWKLQAVETHTGATVPAWTGPRQYRTRHKARKEAERLYAICTSSMFDEPWIPLGDALGDALGDVGE